MSSNDLAGWQIGHLVSGAPQYIHPETQVPSVMTPGRRKLSVLARTVRSVTVPGLSGLTVLIRDRGTFSMSRARVFE